MKKLLLTMTAAATGVVYANTTTVSSVTQLVDALGNYQGGNDIIYVAPGNYDLSGVQMSTDKGGSHLFLKGASLKGTTSNCDDVKLIGDGTLRVLDTDNSISYQSTIENITVTNGWAKTVAGVSTSGSGGGIRGYHYCKNCKIVGNRADKNGGGMSTGSHANMCWILNNTAGGQGGGVFSPNDVIDSVVQGNTSTGDGGGIHGGDSYAGVVRGSVVTGNTSDSTGGGICSVKQTTNTVVSLNTAVRGGGLASWDISKVVAIDCTVCSNKVTTYGGGGLYQYKMNGGSLFANATVGTGQSANGGGASVSQLTGVDIHDNHANGKGGGVHNCTVCEECTIWNNTADGDGRNAIGSNLVACDVSGTEVHSGTAARCVFHDVGVSVTINNPHVEKTAAATTVFAAVTAVTNCLFHSNVFTSYSASLVTRSGGTDNDGSMVNCTFVSNQYSRAFGTCTSTAHPLYVENCAYYGNRNYNATLNMDLCVYEDSYLKVGALWLANIAYGKADGLLKDSELPKYIKDGSQIYKFGKDGVAATPGFVGAVEDPENPFALTKQSTLRRKGAVADWMETATDIRGEGHPRLYVGIVDIGCYQYWQEEKGLILTIR